MPKTTNYDRDKAVLINDTPIVASLFAGESDVGAVLVAGGGLTAILISEHHIDVDEGAGVDVQVAMRLTTELVMTDPGNGQGKMVLTIVAVPVKGDGTLGTARNFTVDHPESISAFQTAGGRAPQA